MLCFDDATAKRCAEPIDLGQPESPYVPIVLTPADLPVITDPDEAVRSPELASLSLIAPGPAEQWGLLEEKMKSGTWLVNSDFAKEHYGRGEAKGEIKGERRTLPRRG